MHVLTHRYNIMPRLSLHGRDYTNRDGWWEGMPGCFIGLEGPGNRVASSSIVGTPFWNFDIHTACPDSPNCAEYPRLSQSVKAFQSLQTVPEYPDCSDSQDCKNVRAVQALQAVYICNYRQFTLSMHISIIMYMVFLSLDRLQIFALIYIVGKTASFTCNLNIMVFLLTWFLFFLRNYTLCYSASCELHNRISVR